MTHYFNTYSTVLELGLWKLDYGKKPHLSWNYNYGTTYICSIISISGVVRISTGGGANFRWPLVLTQRGRANWVFQIFLWWKQICLPRGPWPNAPPLNTPLISTISESFFRILGPRMSLWLCLQYTPNCPVVSSISNLFSVEGVTAPPPQTLPPPPRIISCFASGSGLDLNSRALRGFDFGFALSSWTPVLKILNPHLISSRVLQIFVRRLYTTHSRPRVCLLRGSKSLLIPIHSLR